MRKRKKALHGAEGVLSCPVVRLPGNKNCLSWAGLIHGLCILGGSSSGKTTGPGAWLLNDILQDKYQPAMMVLCVKPSEKTRVEKMAKEANRTKDLVIFSKESSFSVNAMEQELFRNGRQDVNYDHAVDLLIEIATLAENYAAGGASGNGSDDRYWVNSMKLRLKRLLMLLVISGEEVSIANMRRAMIDGFSEEDVNEYTQLRAKIENGNEEEPEKAQFVFEQWCANNYFLHCFETANTKENLTAQDIETLFLIGDYFLKEYVSISSKTRSIVDSSISSLFEMFTTGILKSHFDGEMSPEIKPEVLTKEGKIIIVDFPISEFGISAVVAMGIMKKLFQLCQQRRRVDLEESPRPVVLWVDEAHLVINATSDEKFQSICRESMTACVYITQSINAIKLAMGNNGEVKTKALLTNLGTTIACRNNCRDSNIYISDLIGKDFIKTKSSSLDTNDRGSQSTSEQLNYIVPPEHMASLKSGRAINKFQVETIVVVGGKGWSTGENFLECSFDQRGRQPSFIARISSFIKSIFQ